MYVELLLMIGEGISQKEARPGERLRNSVRPIAYNLLEKTLRFYCMLQYCLHA